MHHNEPWLLLQWDLIPLTSTGARNNYSIRSRTLSIRLYIGRFRFCTFAVQSVHFWGFTLATSASFPRMVKCVERFRDSIYGLLILTHMRASRPSISAFALRRKLVSISFDCRFVVSEFRFVPGRSRTLVEVLSCRKKPFLYGRVNVLWVFA